VSAFCSMFSQLLKLFPRTEFQALVAPPRPSRSSHRRTVATVDPEVNPLGEVAMVGQERWQEIHRAVPGGARPRGAVARRLDLRGA
jgi:hypothetical protein